MSSTTPKPHWLVRVGAYSFISVFLSTIFGVALLVLICLGAWLWSFGTGWQVAIVILAALLASTILAVIGGAIQVTRERREHRKEWSA